MRYDAVIFDLFGTLVDQFTYEAYVQSLHRMAEVFGVDAEAFAAAWLRDEELEDRRMGGSIAFEDDVTDVCRELGRLPEKEQVEAASGIYINVTRQALLPRDDALPTLMHLRSSGRRVGLLSNTSWETPIVWPETPFAPHFDDVLLSCDVGLCKPAPAIYRLACERLGVAPERTVFVGDNGSDELRGAAEAGLHPVLICVPHECSVILGRGPWNGPVIDRLSGLLDLLE